MTKYFCREQNKMFLPSFMALMARKNKKKKAWFSMLEWVWLIECIHFVNTHCYKFMICICIYKLYYLYPICTYFIENDNRTVYMSFNSKYWEKYLQHIFQGK